MPRTVDELLEEARARFVRLAPAQAAAAQTAGAVLVDIRGDDQIRTHGCIPGAIRIQRNVVVCQEGYQSSLAASNLHELGFRHATDLEGGFEAWRAADMPIEAAEISRV